MQPGQARRAASGGKRAGGLDRASDEHGLFDVHVREVDWVSPRIVVVRVFDVQLSNVAFHRNQSHDQSSNSNRLAWDKFNLVELHGENATCKKDSTTFHQFRRYQNRQDRQCNE